MNQEKERNNCNIIQEHKIVVCMWLDDVEDEEDVADDCLIQMSWMNGEQQLSLMLTNTCLCYLCPSLSLSLSLLSSNRK